MAVVFPAPVGPTRADRLPGRDVERNPSRARERPPSSRTTRPRTGCAGAAPAGSARSPGRPRPLRRGRPARRAAPRRPRSPPCGRPPLARPCRRGTPPPGPAAAGRAPVPAPARRGRRGRRSARRAGGGRPRPRPPRSRASRGPEGQRGHEGGAQHLQGDHAVTLARGFERAGLVVHATERPECREAAERVEEASGEAGEGDPLPPGALLRRAPDEPHEERDQRDGEEEDEAGEGVAPQHRGQHQGGDDGRERGLRQVLPDVRVEGVHPADQRVRELAGPLARGEPRPEREEPAHEAVAHRPSHLGREPLGERLLEIEEPRARGGHPRDRGEHRRERRQGGPPERSGVDRRGSAARPG